MAAEGGGEGEEADGGERGEGELDELVEVDRGTTEGEGEGDGGGK